jgi:hypothetical protein
MPLDTATDARTWADHHAEWTQTATAIVGAVRQAFEVLHDIEFAAPWKTDDQVSAAVNSSDSSPAQPSGSAASRS